MKVAFHRYLKRLLIEAFSSYEVSPEQVAMQMQHTLIRPCEKSQSINFQKWLTEKNIERLVHFTQIENVVHIHRYGLIPREHLELEVFRLALGPRFSDSQRTDDLPEYNCLSITSPNYKMFYSKRMDKQAQRWAVIEFKAEVVTQLHFLFAPTNAASGCSATAGVEGANGLFSIPLLRRKLGLQPKEPTDPQAEVLCDSILGNEAIKTIYVENKHDANWLVSKGVHVQVAETPFKGRRDAEYWRGKRVTDLAGFENVVTS